MVLTGLGCRKGCRIWVCMGMQMVKRVDRFYFEGQMLSCWGCRVRNLGAGGCNENF